MIPVICNYNNNMAKEFRPPWNLRMWFKKDKNKEGEIIEDDTLTLKWEKMAHGVKNFKMHERCAFKFDLT